MMRYKYFYKGMPLMDYCKEHELVYVTIVSKFKKRKKLDKYNNYSDEQLIEMVINDNKELSHFKYFYNGTTLSEYCKQNNIPIANVYQKIKAYKTDDKYEGLTDEEIIKIVIENIHKIKSKYWYRGVPLKQYCLDNNLSYTKIYQRFKDARLYAKYDQLDDEQLIEFVVENDQMNRKTKYYYKGKPFSKYCKDNGLPYPSYISVINALKRSKQYKNYSDDQLVELVVEHYDEIKNSIEKKETSIYPKYIYKGMTLSAHCKKMGIKYYNFRNRIINFRNNEYYKSYSLDQLIGFALEDIVCVYTVIMDYRLMYIVKKMA